MSLNKVLTKKVFFRQNVPSVFRFSNRHGRYEGRNLSRRISAFIYFLLLPHTHKKIVNCQKGLRQKGLTFKV